jgi:hypothetical protein
MCVLQAFARMTVSDRDNPKALCAGVTEALGLLRSWIGTAAQKQGPLAAQELGGFADLNMRLCFCHALANMIAHRDGRMEFIATPYIDTMYPGGGPKHKKAVEDELTSRFQSISRVLETLPGEEIEVFVDKVDNHGPRRKQRTVRVTAAGIDLAEATLRCLSLLSREYSIRSHLAFATADHIVAAIPAVMEDPGPLVTALQCLYNYCYLCEDGQHSVHASGRFYRRPDCPNTLIDEVRIQ